MPKNNKDAKDSASRAAKLLKGRKAHLVLLLDESGSMSHNQEAVVTSVNEFLDTFRKQKNADVRVWLSTFDKTPGEPVVRQIVAGEKIKKVKTFTTEHYQPRGTTPLNDAILATIDAVEKHLSKDETVYMVILTDGLENASEAKAVTVKKQVEKREAGDQWTFLYLGANQHAETMAADIGLKKRGTSMNFTASQSGTRSAVAYATQDAVSSLAMPKHAHEALRSQTYDNFGGVIKEEDEAKA
jgi:Mg-chelatase subunit ChlD